MKLVAWFTAAIAGLMAWVASLLKRQGASDAAEEYHEQRAKEAEDAARRRGQALDTPEQFRAKAARLLTRRKRDRDRMQDS